MPVIQRSARVPYSADRMLALVNDVEAYPEFLHWCRSARIEREEGGTVDASLDIGVSGIHRMMRTRNTTEPVSPGKPARIRIRLLEGPLQRLEGAWTFHARGPDGCDIDLRLEYETHRTPFGLLLKTLFDEIANSQLKAFVRRAAAIYGHD